MSDVLIVLAVGALLWAGLLMAREPRRIRREALADLEEMDVVFWPDEWRRLRKECDEAHLGGECAFCSGEDDGE